MAQREAEAADGGRVDGRMDGGAGTRRVGELEPRWNLDGPFARRLALNGEANGSVRLSVSLQ